MPKILHSTLFLQQEVSLISLLYRIPGCCRFLSLGKAEEQLNLILWKKKKEGRKEDKREGVLQGYSYFTILEEDDLRIRYFRRAYNIKEFACWPDIKLPEWKSEPGVGREGGSLWKVPKNCYALKSLISIPLTFWLSFLIPALTGVIMHAISLVITTLLAQFLPLCRSVSLSQ